jgi:hypothetical protein
MVMPVIKLFFNKKWQTTGIKKDITELYSFIDDFTKFTLVTEKSNYYLAINSEIAYVV